MTELRNRTVALGRLLEDSPGGAAPSLLEGLISCCDELVLAGEPQTALDLLGRAAKTNIALQDEWRLRLAFVKTRALRAAGLMTEALRSTRKVLSEDCAGLSNLPDLAFRFRMGEAESLWHLGRPREAVELLLGVRSELLARPDSALLAVCAHQLLCAYLVEGDYGAARMFAMESIVSARRSGSQRLEALALDNLSRIDRMACRWASAQEAAEAALAKFETHGYRTSRNHCLRGLALIWMKRGDLARALDYAEGAISSAAALGIDLLEGFARLLKSFVLLHAGNYGESWKILSQVRSMDLVDVNPRISLLAIEYLGDIHLEQAKPIEALGFYDDVWPKALALVPKGDIVAELRRRRAECYHLLGRFDEAYEEAKAGLDHCRELGDRYEEAATYRILALSASALGRSDEAKQHFDQGFAYYEDIETPYEWGKLWMAYGDWVRDPRGGSQGDIPASREAYEAARDLFERMGAQAKLAEAVSRLASEVVPSNKMGKGQLSLLSLPADGREKGASVVRVPSRRRPRKLGEVERKREWAHSTFGVVTRSLTILKLLEKVEKLARSSTPILVLGESGTGKELVATGLHRLSGRRGQFMPINCSTLPREMIESELFGHVTGAFTGAMRDKAGLLEVCDGGTVFLDEIADLPLELQARLLRFLETGEVRRVGATRNVHVKTRVVAATNRVRADLERGDSFRRDLYYRLAHAVVDLPPLRRRGDDIALLLDHFLSEACEAEGKDVRLSVAARSHLEAYGWPGNVRQLKATMRRLVLLAVEGQEVGVDELELEDGDAPATLAEELEEAERRRIEEALRQSAGSRTEAAKALGMPRTTLLHKMRRHGLA